MAVELTLIFICLRKLVQLQASEASARINPGLHFYYYGLRVCMALLKLMRGAGVPRHSPIVI